MTEQWEWRGTHKVEAPTNVDRIPPYDERSGEHCWLFLVGYQVFPLTWAASGNTPKLDQENLVNISGPGCYYCEEPYSERLARRRCKGELRAA
jgi:hypothetical protein